MKTKVGGLTLPLNDCTEAGVQGLHRKEFHDFTCSEMIFPPLASEKVGGGLSAPPTPQSVGG